MDKGNMRIKKVALAYSGGMDTSVILKWLQENYGCEVITLTCDLGQEEDLEGVDKKALATGAVKAYVEDLREEFARDFIYPMFRAGAVYENRYLLGTSIARPLIAKRLVEIARAHGADAVAHGATGKGNDQVRFELTVNALAPDLRIIAPWRLWNLKSRSDLTAFAERHGIPLSSGSRQYSMDRNMLHLSFEGSELEDPWKEAGPGSYIMTVPPEKAPDRPEYIALGFEKGDAVAVNGEKLHPAALIKTLNALGGRHGIGRIDMVENRFVGMKARGVYETPGGSIIFAAHRDLEGITLDREVMRLRDGLIPQYSAAIYNGFWYSPEREAIQALVDKTQERVSGEVRLKLYKGNVLPVARRSPYSLFRRDLATFERDEVYNQADAAGFIRLQGLRLQGYRKDLIRDSSK
jgi:argininosuccinate synthase